MKPSPEASKETLIRRVTLDLTGLPPTPTEVDAFLKDSASDAYEKLVDRLLASPRYGERMALDWLDAARYADTHGYHIDSGRDMTRWREWVIDAYNRNLPFDTFTVEQLAGDLLPNPTVEQKVASGFNRNNMINFEGGAIPEEYLTAYVVDRVNTTGTVFLGLTVGCAQCHDHKFDPITQREYYGLFAFFHNVPENGLDGSKGNAAPLIPVPRPEQRAEIDRLSAEIARTEAKLNGSWPELDSAQAAWESSGAAHHAVAWSAIDPSKMSSRGKAKLAKGPDRTIIASGRNPDKDVYTVTAPIEGGPISAIRIEALTDPSLTNGGPGRSVNGNVVLTDVTLEVAEADAPDEFEPVALAKATADFSQDGFPVSSAIDGKPETGWAIDPQEGKPHAAVFSTKSPVPGGRATALRLILAFGSPFASHQLGKFRVSVTSAKDPHAKEAIPAAVASALAKKPDARSESDRTAIRSHYRTTIHPQGKALSAKLAALKSERSAIEAKIPTAMVMQEMPRPRDTFILRRGQYDQKGEKVAAIVPASLPPLPKGCAGEPADAREVARSARASSDEPRGREPDLAGILRRRTGEDGRGLRLAGRAAEPSRTARLAGRRVPRVGMGREGDREADRHVLGLSPKLEGHARGPCEGPRGSPARPRPEAPPAGRVHPRRRPRGQRPARRSDRRRERLALPAGGALGGADVARGR